MNQTIKRLLKKMIPHQLLGQKSQLPFTLLRQFEISDLKKIPSNWKIQGPNFVGVAAGKSGTSWWYSLILDHPQVVQNRLHFKELHYFDHLRYKSITQEEINAYRQAFAAPDYSICGEWTPNYLTHPCCLENLSQAAPNTKILLLLRNPIDRMISHINFLSNVHSNSFRFNQKERYFYELYTIYLNGYLHSSYSVGLRELLKHFNRSQILVLQYEKCKLSPLEEIKKTYQFLEIDEEYIPHKLKTPINVTNYRLSPIDIDEKERLNQFFAEEMQLTKNFFPEEIDLSLWTN